MAVPFGAKDAIGANLLNDYNTLNIYSNRLTFSQPIVLKSTEAGKNF